MNVQRYLPVAVAIAAGNVKVFDSVVVAVAADEVGVFDGQQQVQSWNCTKTLFRPDGTANSLFDLTKDESCNTHRSRCQRQ